jgi:hypothetical protein
MHRDLLTVVIVGQGNSLTPRRSLCPFRWAVPCKAKKLLALAIFVEWKLPFIHNDLQALIEIAILAGAYSRKCFYLLFPGAKLTRCYSKKVKP